MSKVNSLSGAINNINMNMANLSDRISTITQEQKKDSNNSVSNSDLEELKHLVNKVQLDVVTKHTELKRELDSLRREEIKKEVSKESKLLETMVMHKVEQLLSKSLKDRTTNLSDELKHYVDTQIASLSSNRPDPINNVEDDENYEIAVTLAGETQTTQEKPKRKSVKKRPVDV